MSIAPPRTRAVTLTRLAAGHALPELVSAWIEAGVFDELVASWQRLGVG